MIRRRAAFASALPAGYDGEFLWDWLSPAFGGRIEPMDFDAVVEIGGRFLIFETKADGVELPQGQRIALEAIARLPEVVVLVVQGKTPETISGWEAWHGDERRRYNGDADALYGYCERWATWARRRRALECGSGRSGSTERSAHGSDWPQS